MSAKRKMKKMCLPVLLILSFSGRLFSDQTFDNLIAAGKYKEALDYADDKIPNTDRDGSIWMKIARANEELGMTEKALACYLVSWRMNPNDYLSLLGAAKVYNKLNQPDNAINMAKKALDQKFTADASWEYAKACIALNRAVEAKAALEKVIQSDSTNAIANRELGNIYYNEKNWIQAIPLLKKTYRQNGDGQLAFKIGKAYVEAGVADSSLVYLKSAMEKGGSAGVALDLARAYFGQKNYKAAEATYDKVSQSQLEASDYYKIAVSKEKNGSSGVEKAYEAAVQSFGSSTSNDALVSREKAGRSQLKNNNYKGALENFQFIVKADEKGTVVHDIYFLLADALQGEGEMQKAIASLERAIALNSRNVEAYARLADLYQKNGMTDNAKRAFETLMSLSPNDPGVYLALGQYNIKAKKFTDALNQMEKADNLRHSAVSSEGIAVAAFNLNNFEKAKEAAKAAISLDPGVWDSRIVLAKISLKDKDYHAAQEQLEYIIAKEPFNASYLSDLAVCYEQTGQNDKLAEIDKKIVSTDRTNVESRERLAKFADNKNDLETALKYYGELTTLTPKSAEVFKRLYSLNVKKGNKAEAVVNLQKYCALSSGDAEAQRDLGDLLYDMKNLDGALQAYRTALKINPNIKGFYKRYAEIVIAKGQQDEVITALSKVVQNGEADIGTFTTLGLIYQKKKQYTNAIDMYQKALQKDPANFDALVALGSCQAASGDLNQAIISYEQAVMMNAQVTTELKDLGELYMKLGRNTEALATFQKYLEKIPGDAGVSALVGKDAFEKKDYANAAKYLAVASKKGDEETIFMFGTASLNSGKYSDAINAFEKIRADKKSKISNRELLKSLAESFEKSGKNGEAAKVYSQYASIPGVKDPDASYKQAFLQEKTSPLFAEKTYELNMKLFPSDYRNYLRLGLMFSENKETLPKAVPLLKRVTGLADSVPTVWLELAQVYGKMKNENEELNAYRKYSENDPKNLEANKRIGTILMKKGEVTDALVYLEMANSLQPNDPDVMKVLAGGYVKTGRGTEAIELLLKAKDAKKDDPDIRYQIYQLYMQTGQKDKAQKEIKELVDMKHESKYLLLYADALISQGKLKEASDAVEDILATQAENIDALMMKAKVQRANKKYDDAIETYKEISFINPEHALSLYERAETHMLQSKIQWAETFYNRALKSDPTMGLAELGLAKVCKVRKDMAGYKTHLANAQKLSPDDVQINEEIQKGLR